MALGTIRCVHRIALQRGTGRFNQILVAAVGGLCIGIGLFSLVLGNSYWLAMCSSGLWTIGEMLAFPVLQVVLYNWAGETSKGKHMGFYQTIYAFANIAGPILGSWTFKLANGDVLWCLCGLLGILSFYLGKKTYAMARHY
jgi:MFS family permease